MAGRKNNHYHYAEKFDNKRRSNKKLYVPYKAVFVAALVLLMFGFISTTFGAFVASEETVSTSEHSILVDVRTAKAQRDIAITGANVDLAETSYDVTSGAVVYFDTTGWDIANYSHVQIMIGHSSYSSCYDMTKVSGNLYYVTMPSWGGFTQLCFIANDSSWNAEGNSPDSRKTYAHHYTNTWGSSNLTNTKYVFRAASSNNNSNLSSINDGSYNTLLNSTFNLYAVTKKGTDNYKQSTDGGVATQAGTTKNTTNATSTATYSTSTSSANPAVNYPMIGTAVTLTNSKKTGYKFDDYVFDDMNGSNTTGSPLSMTSWKNETTNVFARFSEVMHKVKITSNTPKINSGSTGVTTSNGVVGVATTYTATAPTKTGYTFTNWSNLTNGITKANGSAFSTNELKNSSITFIYTNSSTSTQTCSLKANYTLNAPTGVSISNKTMKVGDAAVSLNPTSTVPSGITKTVTYSIEDANGNAVSSSVASVNSSGQFTATIPGVYTVTMHVTASDGTLTSVEATGTATVTVSPAKPQWTLTMSGYDAGGDLNNGSAYGSENNPYLVTLGSNFSFTASINNPPSDSNYVYTWYNSNGESLGTGSSLTFGAATASEATTANVEVEIYCVVSYTGATPTTTSDSIEKWYYIKSLIKSFTIPDQQKIYATPNEAKMDIEYNIPSATGYDTSLYFSSDNLTFYQVDVAHGAFLGAQIAATAVYRYDPSAQMYPVGPKYFYLAMSKTGASAKTDVIHTTVGANNASATRPIYFINNASLDLSTYRVMAFYLDGDGELKYQTAQDVFKGVTGKTENIRYRVMLPSDATKVSFAVAKSTKYKIPASGQDHPDYSADFFYAYTDFVTLTSQQNTVKANTKTNTGTEADPLYALTTQYLPYESAG